MSRRKAENARDVRLEQSRQRATAWTGSLDPEVLAALAQDRDPRERLLALALMQRAIYEHDVPAIRFLPVARGLVEDPDNTCRWQALFVVSESMEQNPEDVWQVVVEHGDSADEDMQQAVAYVVLEHLLEQQFEELLPKLREALRDRSLHFAETVRKASGWFREDDPRHRRLQQVLRLAARGRPPAAPGGAPG